MIDFDKLHARLKAEWKAKTLRAVRLGDIGDDMPADCLVVCFASLQDSNTFCEMITKNGFPDIIEDMIMFNIHEEELLISLDGTTCNISETFEDYYMIHLVDYELNFTCPYLDKSPKGSEKEKVAAKPAATETQILFIP
jgi:hypothetical protein